MDQMTLPLKLVERLINVGFSLVTKWVDAWFNNMKMTLLVSIQRHGHPPLWRYLDKAGRLPNREKLIDKI